MPNMGPPRYAWNIRASASPPVISFEGMVYLSEGPKRTTRVRSLLRMTRGGLPIRESRTAEHRLDRRYDRVRRDPNFVFERGRVGYRNPGRAEPSRGRLQAAVQALGDGRDHLGPEPRDRDRFLCDEQPPRPADAREHGVLVPGPDRTKVEEVHLNPPQGQRLGGRGADMDLGRPRDDGDVAAPADIARLAKRDGGVRLVRHLALERPEALVLHEHNRIVTTDRALEKPLVAGRRRRADDD